MGAFLVLCLSSPDLPRPPVSKSGRAARFLLGHAQRRAGESRTDFFGSQGGVSTGIYAEPQCRPRLEG